MSNIIALDDNFSTGTRKAVCLNPARIINGCPDCKGRGKIAKNWQRPNTLSDCPTCGNEPDAPEGLVKRRGLWYKPA